MKKIAQTQSTLYAPGLTGKDLGDIYAEIRRDASLNQQERIELIQALRKETGYVSESTPLSVLLAYGAGGVLGALVSRYLGVGNIGQLMSAAIGARLGKMVYDRHEKPKPTLPGWKLL